MKKICLYYFSGTGMTKYVVDRLIGEIEKYRILVDCFKIEESNGQDALLSEYDALMIAYPTHSLNAPKIVVDFAKQLPKSNNMNTFIVHTSGVDSVVNYGSSDLLIKKLSKRGYRVRYNRLVEMPSNFANKDSEKQVIKTLAKANDSIVLIAKDIAELQSHFVKRSFGLRILTSLARAEWLGAPIIGKFFYVKSDCVRCKKCIDHCPNKNIVMNKKFIGFKSSCGICMRCVYQCPKNAISIHQPFKFICFDKWYDSEMFK